MSSNRFKVFALLFFSAFVGCGDLPSGPASAVQPKKTVVTKQPQKKTEPKPAAVVPPKKQRPDIVNDGFDPAQPVPRSVGKFEELAVGKVTTIIKQSLELGPTLVVWILDRTPSAQEILGDVTAAAENYYESSEVRELAKDETKPLLTAIVSFDDATEFIVDPPTSDTEKLKSGFNSIKQTSQNHGRPFTAIKQAIEKYLPLRTADRREVVLVVVTDEAGDDAAVAEELVEPLRRNAIPLYVIGLPAPWGQTNPNAKNPKAVEEAKDDLTPTYGPESFLSERVDLDNWTSHYAVRANTSLVDSGFGPFALERLCRASRGQFFALRPGLGYGFRGVSARSWPSGEELRFEEKVLSKYAPDYVSEAEYRKHLAENKAKAALCDAAKLPKVMIEGSPGTHFRKDVEAKMAKQMSAAQQFAARNLPEVDRLYGILAPGEADRAKLTGPRWQAEFDLAFGRVLANKTRLDGYNSMIAALKRGKNFTKPESKEWVLEPADNFETESTIRKMAEKAKAYLDRVVQEHPGTPWAKIAEEELKMPLGWTWKEA